MATQPPSNAPDDLPDEPREDATAATVLGSGQSGGVMTAGGGLGGAGAAEALSGSSGSPSGPSPNSPVDVPVPEQSEAAEFSRDRSEAVRQAADATPAEPHPSSL